LGYFLDLCQEIPITLTDSMFDFTDEDIYEYSRCSQETWENDIHDKVLQTYPYDLVSRKNGLHEIYKVLSEYNIRYWLAFGALLGAVRDSDFISWDDNVDLLFFNEDFSLIFNSLKESFIGKGFIVRIRHDRFPIKFQLIKYGQRYNLLPMEKSGKWRVFGDIRVPGKFFSQTEVIFFKGIKFYVPSPKKDFLKFVYGEDWVKPKKPSEDYLDFKVYYSKYLRFKYFVKKIIKY
jgi:hypothetical protein